MGSVLQLLYTAKIIILMKSYGKTDDWKRLPYMECAIIWKAKFRSRHGGNDRKMKNHVNVDGRLLQTNKKYSQPKVSQKEKIAEWLFQETKEYYASNGIYPSREHLYE